MDVETFLRHVLPPTGVYVSATINDGKPRQKFHDTVAGVAARVEELQASPTNNIYYAVASFTARAGGRKQANVQSLKAFFVDVDAGQNKPFPDWREGLKALLRFVTDTGLPKPMVVASGNGLHVYWVLDEAVSRDVWEPVAEALKAATITHEFTVDAAVISDSARVLRPVGTTNPKGGGAVRVLINAPVTTLETMRDCLAKFAGAIPTRKGRKVSQQSSLLDSLAVTASFPPAEPSVVVSKCAQVRWGVENQKDVPEPFWYALMGIAAHCHDPEQTAVNWSHEHPDYDLDATIRKLDQWRASATGPATCTRFEQERPKGCAGCPFAGRIGSPVRLGTQQLAVPPSHDAPEAPEDIIGVPKPFKRTSDGMKVVIDGVDIDVCKFDIYPVGYGYDETLGFETVRYRWKRPHMGWQTLSFRQAFLTDGSREFATAIADQGIVLQSQAQTGYFQLMLRTYMDALRNAKPMSNMYSSMGWKDAFDKFLIGDDLVRNTGNGVETTSVMMASKALRTSGSMFGVKGDLRDWAAFTSVLDRANMPIHMFALCAAMSAPLYKLAGLHGLVINLYGPTGAGKTLAQLWQQSVWGDPAHLHYTAKFTHNALFTRMGFYNNLPVTIDEATILGPKDVGDFLYWVCMGRDKARLTQSAEEREAKTWSTVVTTSANRSLSSMLTASGLDTDAQQARLLEITIQQHKLFTKDTKAGQMIHDFVSNNYGTAGRAIVEYLVSLGEHGIKTLISAHREEFNRQYSFTFSGSERFWEQGIILADLMGSIALDKGWIRFDYTKGTRAVLDQIGGMRRNVTDNSQDAFDVLAEYLNEHAGMAVTIMHTGGNKGVPDTNRIPKGEVRIRFDIYRPTPTAAFDKGIVLVDRKHFKTWVSIKGCDYKSMVSEYSSSGVLATPKNDKAYLGRDTGIKLGQQYVVGINLAHPRLVGILTDAEEAATSSLLTKLGVIQGGKTP